MNHKILKRYIIKIPDNVTIYYCEKKQFIVIQGKLGKKSFKLPTKIIITKDTNLIKITKLAFTELSNNLKKKLKSLQGLAKYLIKKAILEVSRIIHKKLKLIGLGYKVFNLNNYNDRIIYFKLGYSHFIYFKIPKNLKIINMKNTKLFLMSDSYNTINTITSILRSYKYPEPYKGKGILYVNEQINLKEGKKLN